jgi:hypothetical protein
MKEKIWTDNDTGLTWEVDIQKDKFSFDEAFEYAQNLNKNKFAGFDDWRVPTLDELLSIGNIPLYDRRIENKKSWTQWYKDTKSQAHDNQKSNTKVTYIKEPLLESMGMGWQGFWSSTVDSDDENYAWMLGFGNGASSSYLSTGDMCIRCVRG